MAGSTILSAIGHYLLENQLLENQLLEKKGWQAGHWIDDICFGIRAGNEQEYPVYHHNSEKWDHYFYEYFATTDSELLYQFTVRQD